MEEKPMTQDEMDFVDGLLTAVIDEIDKINKLLAEASEQAKEEQE